MKVWGLGKFWSRSQYTQVGPLTHGITCVCAVFLGTAQWPGEARMTESQAEETLTELNAWITAYYSY